MIKWLTVKTQIIRLFIFFGVAFLLFILIMLYISFFYLDIRKTAYLKKYCNNIQIENTTIENIKKDLKNYKIDDMFVRYYYIKDKLIRDLILQEKISRYTAESLKEIDPNIKAFSIGATDKTWDFERCNGDYEVSTGKILHAQFVSD